MQTEHNVLFFLLLSLLQLHAGLWKLTKERCALLITGTILERLFSRATYDETSRKASVDQAGDEARMLAHAVIAEVDSSGFDRVVRFRGKRLIDEKEDRLRKAGTDIGLQEPVSIVDIAEEITLPFSEVLQCLSADSRQMARDYFSRAKDLRDVFTRQTRGPTRRFAQSWPRR